MISVFLELQQLTETYAASPSLFVWSEISPPHPTLSSPKMRFFTAIFLFLAPALAATDTVVPPAAVTARFHHDGGHKSNDRPISDMPTPIDSGFGDTSTPFASIVNHLPRGFLKLPSDVVRLSLFSELQQIYIIV